MNSFWVEKKIISPILVGYQISAFFSVAITPRTHCCNDPIGKICCVYVKRNCFSKQCFRGKKTSKRYALECVQGDSRVSDRVNQRKSRTLFLRAIWNHVNFLFVCLKNKTNLIGSSKHSNALTLMASTITFAHIITQSIWRWLVSLWLDLAHFHSEPTQNRSIIPNACFIYVLNPLCPFAVFYFSFIQRKQCGAVWNTFTLIN